MFEQAVPHLVTHEPDLAAFEVRFRNDSARVMWYPPAQRARYARRFAMTLSVLSTSNTVTEREPSIRWAPLPGDSLGPSIFTERNPRPLPFTGHGPDSPVTNNVVVTVEPVILEGAREVMTGFGVYAHHAERVERLATDHCAFVLNEEELPGVPLSGVGANPRFGCTSRIFDTLIRTAERLALRAPLAQERRQRLMLVAADRRDLTIALSHRSLLSLNL